MGMKILRKKYLKTNDGNKNCSEVFKELLEINFFSFTLRLTLFALLWGSTYLKSNPIFLDMEEYA